MTTTHFAKPLVTVTGAGSGAGPWRFRLRRRTDPTGISGTGTVASGVVWSNRKAVMQWQAVPGLESSVVFDHWAAIERIHGHHGKTVLEWIDTPPPWLLATAGAVAAPAA